MLEGLWERTYAHLGSGAPQSAQIRLSDWVKRSLILLLPVNQESESFSAYKESYKPQTIDTTKSFVKFMNTQKKLYTWAMIPMSGCRITHCSSQKLAIVQTQSYTEQRKHQSRTTKKENEKLSWFLRRSELCFANFKTKHFGDTTTTGSPRRTCPFQYQYRKG